MARLTDRQYRLALLTLAAVAGVTVLFISTELFPHHSSNHDEGVYLQQAALLLDGQFAMYSPVPEAVQPWFFIQDGARLYPKYTPVTAALFAPGLAIGFPRLVLALVAAANVALCVLLTTEATGRRTGLLAGGLFAAAPLFLLNSALFLSYAPTTAFNLAFALGYVRAVRANNATSRRRYAVAAGTAIGIAFWARPFTAVLFAAPFVCHALVTMALAARDAPRLKPRTLVGTPAVTRSCTVAAFGLVFVALALAYNHVMTGSALVFPYQALAPQDGPGFGYREILGYDRTYTPALALEANALVLWRLLTRWAVAPPLGPLAAGLGLGVAAVRVRRSAVSPVPSPDTVSDHGVRALLAGVGIAVVVGNVYFWGNLNVLAALDEPTDGLISLIGPFYHFDLLVPLAAFGALGIVAASDWLRARLSLRYDPTVARVGLATLLVVATAGGVAAQADALAGPVERNQPYTERYERAYEPFEDRTFENAVVFVPDPYGPWLNHPFQSLRNDPDFDGPVVYALQRDADSRFAVVDAYPDRQLHRYVVRGEWTPQVSEREPVDAAIEPLTVRRAERFRVATRVGVVANAESATVRLSGADGTATYGISDLSRDTRTVEWVIEPGRARVDGLQRYSDNRWITYQGREELTLSITFTQPGGSTVTYNQHLTTETEGDTLRVVWPPRESVCRLVPDCGTRGAYIPGLDEYVAGVSLNSSIAPDQESVG